MAVGVGGVLGTVAGGHLADWSIFRSLIFSSLAMGLSLGGLVVLAVSAALHRRTR